MKTMEKQGINYRTLILTLIAVCCVISCVTLLLQLQLHRVSSDRNKQRSPHTTPTPPPRRILITGVAGFIGFHLARSLTFEPDNVVIGLDVFNDYYDVRLKEDRAYELHKVGVGMYEGDVCDALFLEELFEEFSFTHVIHVAAQAGVRYSVENPSLYIRENIECYVNLLQVLTKFSDCKLIYASSSSVYGPDTTTPFIATQPLSHPGNVYAATKIADETLGYSYCSTYNITMVGLRFFTVYGPWGRPDMAVYKFAEKILDKQDVPKFETNSGEVLERDFTYIDDIIAGVIASLSYTPSECGEVFNLGYGHPENLLQMIGYLEEDLGRKANLASKPVPPSEMLKTYADISLSREMLGYNPTTSLKTGIGKFTEWLIEYRQRRKKEDKTGKSPSRSYRNKPKKKKVPTATLR